MAVEVQDHPAQYKGLITTKTQNIRLKGAALKLPGFYDFLENIFRMNVAPKTLKVKLHWRFHN